MGRAAMDDDNIFDGAPTRGQLKSMMLDHLPW